MRNILFFSVLFYQNFVFALDMQFQRISRQDLSQIRTEFYDILFQLDIQPKMKDGFLVGYLIKNTDKKNRIEKLGLHPGDLVLCSDRKSKSIGIPLLSYFFGEADKILVLRKGQILQVHLIVYEDDKKY